MGVVLSGSRVFWAAALLLSVWFARFYREWTSAIYFMRFIEMISVSNLKVFLPVMLEHIRSLPGSCLSLLRVVWLHLKPGGIYHPKEFIDIYHGHYYIEAILIVIIAKYMLQSSKRQNGEARPLTEEEVTELCEEWEPEPLCGDVTAFQKRWLTSTPVILARDTRGKLNVQMGDIVMQGVLDMTSTDYFNVNSFSEAAEAGQRTLDVIGVGSCGPRGFYGTVDVHLHLEDVLAQFLRTEEAILYSYDAATVPSIIPAFANAKDIVVIDDGCAYAVRLGCQLSRATVHTFKHNDMEDLDKLLMRITDDERRKKKPLNRRFVVVEGLYHHTGDIADLKRIVEIKNRYKFRLLVDESLSIGVLGATGRGACEHCNVPPEDVEILAGSLGHAVGSIGGFCAGARDMVDHQRLSGLGYCFSASLPPYLASTSHAVIQDWMENRRNLNEKQKKLQRNIEAFRDEFDRALGNSHSRRNGRHKSTHGSYELVGDAVSPLIHVRFSKDARNGNTIEEQEMALQDAVEQVLVSESILFTVTKFSKLDAAYRPIPSIRVSMKSCFSEDDVRIAARALCLHLV
jgi:serine palmitoyltransferase